MRMWFTWCGYEVPRMILLHNLKGTTWLDHNKDICACFNLHHLWFQCINTNCVEVVKLVRCVLISYHKNEWLVLKQSTNNNFFVKLQRRWNMVLLVWPILQYQGYCSLWSHSTRTNRQLTYYVERMKWLHEAVHRKRPEVWPNNWIPTMKVHQLTRRIFLDIEDIQNVMMALKAIPQQEFHKCF